MENLFGIDQHCWPFWMGWFWGFGSGFFSTFQHCLKETYSKPLKQMGMSVIFSGAWIWPKPNGYYRSVIKSVRV